MNIYLITENFETFCIRAKTMNKAIEICERSYIEDLNCTDEEVEVETKCYHADILSSCALIGELKN